MAVNAKKQVLCLAGMVVSVIITIALMTSSASHFVGAQLLALVVIIAGVYAAALLVAYSLQGSANDSQFR